LIVFSLSISSSKQRLTTVETNPIKTPAIPDYLEGSNDVKMLANLIENKEVAKIEKETRRREFLISPAVYLNLFSLSYLQHLKEKFQLRFSVLAGLQYTYIWRNDTSIYRVYTKDPLKDNKKDEGKKVVSLTIPFTGNDEDDRIEVCLKLDNHFAILNIYFQQCVAPRPKTLIKYDPLYTIYAGFGITF